MPACCHHKVIIVMDHGPRFAADSKNDIPVSLKEKSNQIQVGIAKKSVWTWAVEGVLEYNRIVSDLFFDCERLFRVCVSEKPGRLLQPTWEEKPMTYSALTSSFATAGPPIPTLDDGIPLAGIVEAIKGLCQKSVQQENKLKVMKAFEDEPKLPNGGSIVAICTLRSAVELDLLLSEVESAVNVQNAEVSEQLLSLDKLDLYIVNVHPLGAEVAVPSSPRRQVTETLSCTVVACTAGEPLIYAMNCVCLQVHDLVSTTVSGIPMKEEAQQGTSVNYDVELFHPRVAHTILEKLKLCGEGGFLQEMRTEKPYPTYKLGWSTPSPKNKWNLFPRTMSAVRVTPASVNSRPSACLTSFVLGGRNVMLEVKRTGPAESIKPNVNLKLISHTLVRHLGRIYIHAIDILPNDFQLTEEENFQWPTTVTEDFDSDDDEDEEFEIGNTVCEPVDFEDESVVKPKKIVAEGSLRTEEMCQLIKECMLRPRESSEPVPPNLEGIPCGDATRHIRQLTRYWPLTKEESLIFQCNGKFNDIIAIFRKATLTTADMETGKKAIYRLLGLRTAKEPLFKGHINCSMVENPKNKEEVYKVAYIELATFLSNYMALSENHTELFKQFMDTLEIDQHISVNTDDVPLGYDELPDPESFIVEKVPSAPPTAHSSRSSSPVPKMPKKASSYNPTEVINVYDLLCSLVPKPPSRPDFVGRVEAGSEPARLYKHIDLSTAPAKGQDVPM